MKRVILGMAVLALATASLTQAAEPASTPESKKSFWRERCKDYSELAVTIMGAHQSGVAMSDAIRVADGNAVIEKLVEAAYDKPRYSSERMKREVAHEFRDEIYKACNKATKK
jgi:hypothetical protein